MDALHTPTWNLDVGRPAVIGIAARPTVSVPGGQAGPRSAASRPVNPSVRGTILAALGAITSLGCAAVIGMVSISGSAEPKSPGTQQPVSTVQAHLPVARP